MHHVIITLDYELFGNGTGCLEHCLTRPTASLLELLQQHGANLTFFVEALEFDRIKSSASGNTLKQYQQVETQLADAAADGHDIQLHIHPQWLKAEVQNSLWQVDMSRWRVGDLSTAELDTCLGISIEYLKQIVPVEQRINVFRAGGWTIQSKSGGQNLTHGGAVLRCLSNAGIDIDSTVAPGLMNRARGDWFDFRRTPARPYWPISDDVCRDTTVGRIVEVPITTAAVPTFRHAKALWQSKRQPSLPHGCIGDYGDPNNKFDDLVGKFSKVLSMGRIMLDFCTLPADLLIEATRAYVDCFPDEENLPIVLIGHNKNFTERAKNELDIYLNWLAQQNGMSFSKYGDWQQSQQSLENPQKP